VLARSQAGQEERRVAPFDAADLLRRLCDDVRPLADAKKLSLSVEGPEALQVEGDAVKVRRIAQNLLLNALKYTRAGSVVLAWGEAAPGDSRRWSVSVSDSGPGFHAGPGAPIVNSLNPSAANEPQDEAPDSDVAAAGDADERPIHQTQGEGLGLAIVKRLCDLLDARGIPFLLTSGYADWQVPDEWQRRPRLQKPYTFDQLRDALRLLVSPVEREAIAG